MKYNLNHLKNFKKHHFFILVSLVIIFMMISNGSDKYTSPSSEPSCEDVTKLEKRLKNILSQISGAGRVDVMITLDSEGEKIILKDNQRNNNSSLFDNESDVSPSEKTVMKKDGSKEEPFIRKHTKAEIRGVIVCTDGAYDEVVKNEIITSCVAVLDVPITRVSVVKRKE